MSQNISAGSTKRSESRSLSRAAKQALCAAALMLVTLACWPQPAGAQYYYYQLGPKRLYQPADTITTHKDVPLVMRDAIQSITLGTRLLAVNPRIIGGDPAPVGIYPWIASVGLRGVPSQDGHFCGGAFVAADWVITAAHCVNKEAANKIQVLGNTNALSEGGTIYPVDRIVIHEKYDDNTSDWDVALLHLTQRFTARTLPLLTPADADRLAPPGGLGVVAGWGMAAEGTDVANALRHVTVQIQSNKVCNGLASYSGAVTEHMLCAGFAEGGKDSCQGDSGGPLAVSDQAGSFYQAGIVSWGEGCGRLNKFGVYTRVSTIQPWVAEKIAGTRVAAAAAPKGRAAAAARSVPGSNSRASVEKHIIPGKKKVAAPAKRAAPKTGNSISYREIDQLIRR